MNRVPRSADDTNLIDRVEAWSYNKLDLSSADAQNGKRYDRHGFGLLYLARGSHPGGMLELELGGTIKTFGPGDSIKGEFTGYSVKRGIASAQSGFASLVTLLQPDAEFREAARLQIRDVQELCGSFTRDGSAANDGSWKTNVQVLLNKLPTANDYPAAALLDVAGFRFLELLLSPCDAGDVGMNNVAFTVTPWTHAGYGTSGASIAYWAEQQNQAVPYAADANTKIFSLMLEVAGRQRMAFSFAQTAGAAIDHFDIIARGVL